MQRGLRVITLQGAIERSPILLSQGFDGTMIISYFGGSNDIFADCTTHNILFKPTAYKVQWICTVIWMYAKYV